MMMIHEDNSLIKIQKEPVRQLRKQLLRFSASQHIRDDNGLTIYSITGNQQGGKSTYGLWILYEMYNGDIDEIMKHVVMSASEFADMIENAIVGRYRMKCIMWDDMSVDGSAATWMTNPLLVKRLGALGDTLGIATKALILTSPSGDMIKAFRTYYKYIVQICDGQGKYDRFARGYKIGRSPMDQRNCSRIFEDHYDIRVPFYEIYAKKRYDISLRTVLDMKKSKEEAIEPIHKKTVKERCFEIVRDIAAGVYEGLTEKEVCKRNNISHGTYRFYKCEYF